MADKFGSEFLVNTTTEELQANPVVAGLTNGRFVVAWVDVSETGDDTSGSAVRVQVFHADGSRLDEEFVAPTTTSGNQEEPTITALADGRFVVAWRDHSMSGNDQDGNAVRTQIFNFDGTKSGPEFLLNATVPGDQFLPSIAGLANGHFVAAWTDHSLTGDDTDGLAIRARRFADFGVPDGNEFLVNLTRISSQFDPAVAGLDDGRFVVVWVDESGGGGDISPSGIRAQVFEPNGTPVGAELLVNTTTLGAQAQPSIAALPGGRFVVAWMDLSEAGNEDGAAIRAQIFEGSVRAGGEIRVNTTRDLHQAGPSVTALSDGRFVITWEDHSESHGDNSGAAIRGQLFRLDGVPSGGEFLVNTTTETTQDRPTITALADGRFVIAWTDYSQTGDDTSGAAIRAQIFDPRTEGLVITGTPDPDEFIGTAEGDTLVGGAGDDLLTGGAGGDELHGGDGIDSAVFAGPRSAYTISAVLEGYQVQGPDGLDFLSSIEFAVFDDMTVAVAPPPPPSGGSPVITSDGGGNTAVVTVEELTSLVTTVTATDPSGDALTYSIIDSPDAAQFQINGVTGALSFITLPEYDAPRDVGLDNIYVVQVRVSDGDAFDEQTIAVTVAEVVEGRGNVLGPDGILWVHDDGTVATVAREYGALGSGWQLSDVGDFDRDGDSDPIVRGRNGSLATWELQNAGHLSHDLGVVPNTWHVVGADDFDGDGDDDILWRHEEGLVVVWEMEAGQYVVNHNLEHAAATWQIDGAGDFDHDGDADILWRHDEGSVVTWEMEGNDYVINHNLGVVGTSWQIGGTGDFDRDGSADILWHHAEGHVVTWAMNGGALDAVHHQPGVSASWLVAGTHDFDLDGDADILWRHTDGQVATWHMEDGSILQTHNFGVVSTAWQIRATGDFDLA